MRITEIITEQELQEGPIGSAVGAVGRGIAKGIGGLAKGAGMIAGIGQGVKRAFGKGKATSAAHIAGDVPKQQAAQQPSASQQAYDQEYAKLTGQPQAAQPAAAAPAQGGGAPAAQPAAQGGAQQKVEPTMQKQPAATGGDVDSIIKQVDALQPAEKQQVLTALQKSSTPAKEQPAADANATPKPTAQAQAGEEKPGYDPQTGKPNAAMQAQNRAAAKAKAPYGYNMMTGKPNPAPGEDDDNPNIVRGTESVDRRGRVIESTQKFILYKPQAVRVPVVESKQIKKTYRLFR